MSNLFFFFLNHRDPDVKEFKLAGSHYRARMSARCLPVFSILKSEKSYVHGCILRLCWPEAALERTLDVQLSFCASFHFEGGSKVAYWAYGIAS